MQDSEFFLKRKAKEKTFWIQGQGQDQGQGQGQDQDLKYCASSLIIFIILRLSSLIIIIRTIMASIND